MLCSFARFYFSNRSFLLNGQLNTELMSKSFATFLIALLLACSVQSHSIKHVVVLMEENRSFDHLLGWAKDLLGIDGLTGSEYNPISTLNTSSPKVYVNKDAPYVANCDPDHLTFATTLKIFGMKQAFGPNASDAVEKMCGFVEFEHDIGSPNACSVMSMFPPEKVPVLTSLAQNFAVMDKFFCSVPGPTWPNRQFAMAGTSGGSTETFNWFQGKPGQLFPQKTIFDQLEEEGHTWANYYLDTPWELFMETLAKSPDNLKPMQDFYDAAASGALPTYSFINPRSAINMTTGEGSNDMHPDHDVALAERFIKEVYEAVRNSPAWNDTLLIVTFDEHGGFYDHVPPPRNVPEPDDLPPFPDINFHFDRLGIRIVTLLVSPWISKGMVISDPPAAQKPQSNSAYDLTSIMATVRKVFNMTSPPLTKRDAWAATFEHALETVSTPRTDCPTTLPNPPPADKYHAAKEGSQPINSLQEFMITTAAELAGYNRDLKPNHHVATQSEAGEWLQRHHIAHQQHARSWKAERNQWKPWVSPMVEWYWLLKIAEPSFNVNSNNETNVVTISTRNKKSSTGAPFCLDHRSDLTVGASPCFVSSDPLRNKDSQQQWVWGADGSMRPASNTSLCVTNSVWSGDYEVQLQPCNSSVTQHYLYFGGSDPGNSNLGFIQFGNGIYSFGLVPFDWTHEKQMEMKKSL